MLKSLQSVFSPFGTLNLNKEANTVPQKKQNKKMGNIRKIRKLKKSNKTVKVEKNCLI